MKRCNTLVWDNLIPISKFSENRKENFEKTSIAKFVHTYMNTFIFKLLLFGYYHHQWGCGKK